MKALTITQPWATLVALGAKRIETRGWATAYRGPVAIHAAKAYPRWARETCDEPPFRAALGNLDPDGLLRGYVLATAELIDCVPTEAINLSGLAGNERYFGDFAENRFAWILYRAKPLSEPLPARGALGLWEWKDARA